MSMRKKNRHTCLVVGASGLIGSRLLAELSLTRQVFALSRHIPQKKEQGPVRWIRSDLTRPWDPAILPGRIDSVIYLAQAECFRDFPEKAPEIFMVNTERVFRFLEYARTAGARTFILASSGGLKDAHSDASGRSDLGFYHDTKRCAELLAQNYTAAMRVITVRFFFVYGPGQRKSMLIPRLIGSVRNKQPIALAGPAGIRINPIHVSDAAKALMAALRLTESRTIEVAGPKVYTIKAIAQIIGRAMGMQPVFKIRPRAGAGDIVGDISAMADFLVAPSVTFEEGITTLL